ncbi:MAG: hypothetical protein JWQ39_849 [Glaciihabitans sp.]|nr:hypothetical protein [Glaciihabitans sp.]
MRNLVIDLSTRMSRLRRVARSAAVGRVVAGIAALALVVVTFVAGAQAADAADVSSFNAGNLITDTVFYDGGGTQEQTIAALLNSKGAGCHAAGGLPCLKDATFAITASAADQYCAAIGKLAGATAARIFVAVGSACNINPAVLVVLVQKEQSLVTRSSPTASAYDHATGYNCPDTAKCAAGTAGFYTQVFHAAKQFQRYRQNPGSYSFRAGAYNSITYHPGGTPSCGSSKVYIENAATAGLYDYTPYQPDKAALANLSGSGDSCSSYGNRNFWRYFNDWFGNTGNLLRASSFEGSVTGWAFGSGVARALRGPAANTVSTAQAGQDYLAANTQVAGQSIYQSVAKKLAVGTTYSGSIWLRAAPGATAPYTGKLVVWGLGGHAENVAVPFSVGTDWTRVSADLLVAYAGHTSIRLQLYLGTTGHDLQLDSASLSPLPPRAQAGPVTISSPSFEQGLGAWTFKNGFMNRVVYTLPALAENGTRFLASNTQVAGRSIGLDVSRVPRSGDDYTATVWMSSGSAQPFSGKLVLWALGGTSEQAATPFSVGPTWTPVTVNLPIARSGHTRLRLETYLGSTGYDLRLDNASLTGNLLSNGSFETGTSGLAASNGTSTISSVASDPTIPGLIAGAKAAEFSVPTAGNSVAVSVNRRIVAGETYTGTVWLRTADPTQTFSGKLAIWATGGSSQVATTVITGVSGTWTQVSVSLTVADPTNTHLKLEVYDSAVSVPVIMDGIVLQ